MTKEEDDGEVDEEDINDLKEILKGDDGYGAPAPPSKDSIFKFFRDILNLKDSSKAANLTESELGKLTLPVRNYQSLAAYNHAEGLIKVSDYLKEKGEITLATSLSRKGFLPQLFVTQIKREQKIKKSPEQHSSWWKPKQKSKGEEEVGD